MSRWLRTAASTAALLVGFALPRDAHAGALTVDASGLDCPDRPGIERLIRLRLGPWSDATPDLSITLDSRPPDQLVVQLRSTDARTERVIPLSDADCHLIPRTVALLANSWLSRRWTKPPPPPPADEPAARVEVAAPAPAPPPPPAPPNFALTLAAGLFSQPADSRLGALVALGSEWTLTPRWGLALEGRFESAVTVALSPGRTAVRVWSLTPSARFALARWDSARLDLLAGPGLCLIDESTTGYSQNLGSRFVDLAALAAVRWRYRIVEKISISAAVQWVARARRERVSVENVEASATLPRARLGAALGFLWEPF